MNQVNLWMQKAISFGNKYARKGRKNPFVVCYFVSVNSPQKGKGFFFHDTSITLANGLLDKDETYDLYLPYAPTLTASLSSELLQYRFHHIYVGADNLVHPQQWSSFALAHQIDYHQEIALEKCLEFNQVYLYHQVNKLPFIALSFGMSIDGKIATHTGDSRYISGPKTRTFVHQLRDRYQAILVGINTVRIDHPKLTARLAGKGALDPDKIILDSHLSISLDEPVLTSSKIGRTFIVTLVGQDMTKKQALEKLGVTIIEVQEDRGQVNIHQALSKLYDLGIDSIFVEGGSTIHFSFIEKGLFQYIYAYISPIIIGGKLAPSAVGGSGFAYLRDSALVDFYKIKRLGEDILVEMRPKKKG